MHFQCKALAATHFTREYKIRKEYKFRECMEENRHGSHTITRLTVHIVWVTKYRYKVLKGEIQKRCRELIIQICNAEDVRIIKGAVSKDHVHMLIEYPPSKSVSELVKRMKGRTSRLLQQ
jgi:putative transposase